MKRFLLGLICFYSKCISPYFPARTCSEYALEAVEKYGAVKGGWLAIKRLARCHPFSHRDIYDPVP